MYTRIYLYVLLIIIVIIIVSLIIVYDIKNIENYQVNNQEDNIPHIIHQTAPADKSKWKQDWYICQESWKKNFPDWEYKLWTDEDNDNISPSIDDDKDKDQKKDYISQDVWWLQSPRRAKQIPDPAGFE